MNDLIDISHWNSLPWFSTGGTRAKKYLHNPEDNKTYYFKKSADKYPLEFWSEIIAYELGKQIRLDVLKYDVAVFENEIGCISQSMIDPDKEELIEGGKYLQAFDSAFSPDDKKLRHQYTFQLIESALEAFKLDAYFDKIFEIIVFDCLIGNGDRHQENWAFIGNYSTLSKSLDEIEYVINSPEIDKLPKWLQRLMNFGATKKGNKKELNSEVKTMKLRFRKNIKFAPIYDSGSSLCRECNSEKIESMLRNATELEAYLRKGLSEIHWDSEKISHFTLISQLLGSQYREQMIKSIRNIVQYYDEEKFRKTLQVVDKELPETFNHVKIPQNRKDLIVKLVSLRAQKLEELIK